MVDVASPISRGAVLRCLLLMAVVSLRVDGFVENCGRTLAAVPTSAMPKQMWRAMGMAPPIKQSGCTDQEINVIG